MTLRPWFLHAASCAGIVMLATGAAGQVVINEVDYDQPSTDRAEYLELYNAGDASVELSRYSLVFVNGANGSTYRSIELPAMELSPGGFYVICGSSQNVPACDLDSGVAQDFIQNGAPDAIALYEAGTLVDALSYEGDVAGFGEGTGAGLTDSPSGATSLSRCPDGHDSDRNDLDFVQAASTPGSANACGSGGGGGSGELGACGDPTTKIHDIQGAGAESPLVGETVVVEGVVVGDFQDEPIGGLFVQQADGTDDGSNATSEGIFVYGVETPLAVGEVVRVRGTVVEHDSLTEISGVAAVATCGQGSVAATTLSFPVAAISDLEAYEGMLVQIPQPMVVSENYNLGRYGTLTLSPSRLYQPTQLAETGAPAAALGDLNERSRIELDDLSTAQNPNPIPYKDENNTRRVGDTVSPLTGILSGRFGSYRIQPTEPVTFINTNPRPQTPPATEGEIEVVSFNVLNFFTTIDEGSALCGPASLGCRGADSALELTRQRTKILNALALLDADVFGLIELENNASESLQSLVDGLNARMGAGRFDYIRTGTLGSDAIKVGFVYRPETVKPVGAFAVLDSSVDARFLDAKNRPALAQTFQVVTSGERFTVVNNHFKSKGSSCSDVGDSDLPASEGGNCNGTRTMAARALVDWLAADPTGSGDDDFLIIGDLNSYAQEDPIAVLKSAGYEQLVETMIGVDASSYVFSGESGYLDYALSSQALSSQITAVAEWHHNGDEPSVLDYNLEYKTDDPFDVSDPFRASDHDSLIVGLRLRASVPKCGGLDATIYVRDGVINGGPQHGKPYRGTLRGTRAADVIVRTGASDRILGRGGSDVMCGGDGDDSLVGGRGDDTLLGEGGNDELLGGLGEDFLSGGPGEDGCCGWLGEDSSDGTCEGESSVH